MDSKQTSQFTTGLVVLTIGVVLLLGQLDAGWPWNMSRLWPLVFVAIGVGHLLRDDGQHRGSGVWFLFLGGLFLMHTFRVLSLRDSWPLFIVAAGVEMLFPRRACAGPKPAEPAPPPAFFDGRRQP